MRDLHTKFGRQTVLPEEKTSLVQNVFDRVAPQYDRMNDLMSLGLHRLWKRLFVNKLPLSQGFRLLDMAAGTGDIGHLVQEKMKRHRWSGDVTLCDLNFDMLSEGQRRGRAPGSLRSCSNAEKLPFPDRSFHGYTISFGLRNVTYPPNALAEAYRVLKPGGVLLCMEFSKVTNFPLNIAYEFYRDRILPQMGASFAQDRNAYAYLAESIEAFYSQEELSAHLRKAGFHHVKHTNLLGGVVAIHEAWKY